VIDPKEALANPPRVKPGTKIKEPGIYDIGMADYHSDVCPGPSISASGINTLLNETARSYFYHSPYNPKRPDDAGTEAAGFRIGRGAHTLAFEPHLFASHYIVRPDRYDSWRTKESKVWRTMKEAEGLTVFDPGEYENVLGIVASLKEHPLYEQGLLEGYCERSLFWQDEETGVWLKSRPDAIPSHANINSNLKCLSRIEPRQVWYQAFDHGYHVQAAMVAMGCEKLLGMKFDEHVLVCVGQKPPHDILIAPLDPLAIEWGRKFVRKGVRRFAECMRAGYWPSYDAIDGEYLKPSEHMINKWAMDPEMK
jgi:hypothetical protein